MRSPATWDYKRVVAVAFVVGVFMDVLDITIVNVALPTIRRDFGASESALEWVVTGYLLSLAVWIPASGWFGDRLGTKRVYVTALVVFTIGSALCGLSQNIEQLVAFRVVQGIGGGMLVPVGQSMLYRAFPPSERARASAVLSIPSVLGPALGPVLGGIIATHTSWRWIFLINIPFGIAAIVFSARFLKEHREPTAGAFDRGGFVLSALAFGSLLFGLAEVPRKGWTDALTLGPMTAGLLLMGGLVVYETRHPDPMLAFRLLRDRMFRVGNVVNIFGMGAFVGSMFVLPFYLQQLRGLSPQTSGLTTFTQAIGYILVSRSVGRAYLRIGPRRMIAFGLALTGVFNLAFQLVDVDTDLWWIRLIMFGRGMCLPLLFIPLTAASFARIAPADTGRGSSLFATQRQVASALGVAVLAAVLFTNLEDETTAATAAGLSGRALQDAQMGAYHRAFLFVAIAYFIGAAVSLLVRDADAANTMGAAARPAPDDPASDDRARSRA
jgi:EmrB/QacA subfamily drug resistance transporter